MPPERPPRAKVLVFGILFWYPLAGVTYQFLHYLIGLRRLGYDVYYVEDSGRWVYDPRRNDLSPEAEGNIARVAPILEAHGLAERWVFRGCYPGGRCYGMSEARLAQLYREADAFLNVTGAQELRDEHHACPRRIYVESDPFAAQVRAAEGHEGTRATLAAHDMLFSFGENLGAADCDVPLGPFRWHPTRQPVVLDFWAPPNPREAVHGGAAYRTIATWHNKGKEVHYRGKTYYWTKDREFLKFLDLPRRRSVVLELAAGGDGESRRLLQEHGWRLTDPLEISSSLDAYRWFIQSARGEFTVVRDQYVRPRTGWFSDRSACFLASGRPVITQETGFNKWLPTGEGLFGFSTMDDILTAIDRIESRYEQNARAARAIAEEYFAAEKVLAKLMRTAGLDG
jgi:hypothetical protein